MLSFSYCFLSMSSVEGLTDLQNDTQLGNYSLVELQSGYNISRLQAVHVVNNESLLETGNNLDKNSTPIHKRKSEKKKLETVFALSLFTYETFPAGHNKE